MIDGILGALIVVGVIALLILAWGFYRGLMWDRR